jgi:ATP-dependent RNA helicase DeaD
MPTSTESLSIPQAFNAMGLSVNMLKSIEELGFKIPTPIQEKIIPMIFETENDIVGIAQTGTGKTAAFGIPIIEQTDLSNKNTQALILAPTRELCVQISKDLINFSKHTDQFHVTAVYGGTKIEGQIRSLKKGTHIIVATPGRMLDILKRKAADISQIKTLVLDEADEMLNMGFRDELEGILKGTPKNKRTLMFSATMPPEVSGIAKKFLHNPLEVSAGNQTKGAENVRHIYYQVHARDRYLALKRIVDFNPGIYGIVFCRTRAETKEVAEKLIKDKYNADALHGDLSQAQRDHVMNRFRKSNLQLLVATDVAARGIDVEDISHVVNYNLPDDIEIYTHRTGRTGRAGKTGIAISIVNYREKNKIPGIEKNIGKKFMKMNIPSGTEICEKQLFNMIDKMENVEVDEGQIAPFMETVNKKLEWLSKEQIIKHFVSLEFNRFVEYYRNAKTLNDCKEPSSSGDRSHKKKKGKERARNEGTTDFARLFINTGKKEGLKPKDIIGIINKHLKNNDIKIGDIDIKDSFAFFEVDEPYSKEVINTLQDKSFNGRRLNLEFANKDTKKNNKKKKGKGKR